MMPGPHWYLLGIGVEPSYQGHGIGGILIAPVLAGADEVGLPCYVEIVDKENLPFYQKHGFEIANTGRVPAGGPPLWALGRQLRQ